MSDTPGVERVDTAVFTVPTDFQHMLAAGAVDCLQADITRCGGVTVRLRTAALAQVRRHPPAWSRRQPASTARTLQRRGGHGERVAADREGETVQAPAAAAGRTSRWSGDRKPDEPAQTLLAGY